MPLKSLGMTSGSHPIVIQNGGKDDDVIEGSTRSGFKSVFSDLWTPMKEKMKTDEDEEGMKSGKEEDEEKMSTVDDEDDSNDDE